MNKNINTIIEESVKKVLSEMDLVPTTPQGEANLVRRQSVNACRMIYRLMDNVKVKMDNDYQAREGNVTNQDVDGVINYIYNALASITRNSIGRQ